MRIHDCRGRSVQQIDVRKRYGVSILAIYRDDSILMDLRAETKFQQGDSLLVLGEKDDVARVEVLD